MHYPLLWATMSGGFFARGGRLGGTVSSRNRNSLALLISVIVLAAPIAAAPADSPPGESERSLTACPAVDRVDQNAQARQAAAAEDQATGEQWLAERARVLSSLVEVRRADGSVSVDLRDVFLSRIVMQQNPDGTTSIRCFPAGSRVLLPLRPAHVPLEEK
jgi:hypothetical protein